jgi:predicted AlkP superfamily pyrophosphatase or phosphodiesterase
MPTARTFLRSTLSAVLVSVLVGAAPSPAAERQAAAPAPAASEITRVVLISVDGLNPDAITQLGPGGTPTFHRLVAEGASTLNARTEVEMTLTLPNHTGMVTGRRIDKTHGGHGVTWNDDRLVPRTVHEAAGHQVGSVFSSLRVAGLGSAMFAAKGKFALFNRSWPAGIQRTLIRGNNVELVKSARRDLATTWRALTFLHISLPDVVGHRTGFMSQPYLRAVRQTDYLVGRVLTTLGKTAESRDHTLVVVTADHGGLGPGHADPRRYANYRVPFLVWGPGVAPGADLYELNPAYANPGTARVSYAAQRQPVRNGDAGNLVLDVLGLPAISGSELDAAQDLDVFSPVTPLRESIGSGARSRLD